MFSQDDLTTLGQRLKALRQQRGLSAAQVAHEALGCPPGAHVAVTRLERGILKNPRKDHLTRLACYFGVEPAHLFIDKVEDVPQANAPAAPTATKAKKPASVKAAAKPAAKQPAKTLAERIRQERCANDLDESEFAALLRGHGAIITTSDVQAWESEAREPNPLQLSAIARGVKRSESWLLSGKEGPGAQDGSEVQSQAPATRWFGWAPTQAQLARA